LASALALAAFIYWLEPASGEGRFKATQLPVYFEPNRGQIDNRVQFLSRGPGHTLFLMSGGNALLHFPEATLHISLGGARARPRAAGVDPLPATINYFAGSERSKWRTNVSAYSAVRFENVYSGIDLIYHGRNGQLEYDFVVAPGGDPGVIALDFSGVQGLELDHGGNLLISLPGRTIEHRKPYIYQLSGRERREISGRYVPGGQHRVRFEIGNYDRHAPLIIDPVLSYSTLVGGAGNDGVFSVAVDRAGNVYMAGITASTDFPKTSGSVPNRAFPGTTDAFVAKLNPSGGSLIYATYLGGSDLDVAMAVAVDADGNAYVTGGTNSKDFPTTQGAFQARFGGTGGHSLPPLWQPAGDGFVAKLNPSGSALVYSSYIGGAGVDQGYGIAIDSSGAAYIAGTTDSADFPVTGGAFQSQHRGSTDAFVSKVNPAGTSLVYSTFLTGSGEDYAFGLALDSGGNTYVTGITGSDDFPVTSSAFQTRRKGGPDAYVAKLNATGTGLLYSTYLGGSGQTYVYAIAADAGGNAYVTGTTGAPDFPTTAGAFQAPGRLPSQGGDAFLTKIGPLGNALVYSSVFGGSGPDMGAAVALDKAGNAYVGGRTSPAPAYQISSNFPTTPDAVQRCGPGHPERSSAFVSKFGADGAAMEYSSFLDGFDGSSSAAAIAVDTSGRIYVAGSTDAPGFPVTNGAFQATFAGGTTGFDSTNLLPFGGDAFLAKLDLATPSPMKISCVANAASLAPNMVSPGEIVSFFGSGIGPPSGVIASLDNGGRFPSTVAETRVLFDGNPAPLIYVRSDQVNAVAPFGLSGKTTTQVQIEYSGLKSNILAVPVAAGHFGIFTSDSSGSGQAAALNQDYSVNSASNPAPRGSVVILFGTGARLDPAPDDGAIIQGPTLPQAPSMLAYIGACPAEVVYSGSAPGLIAGAIQLNIRVPKGSQCGSGNLPVALNFSVNVPTISVR